MTYGFLYRGFSITIEQNKGIYIAHGWNNSAYSFDDIYGGTHEKALESVKRIIDRHEESVERHNKPLLRIRH